MTANGLLHAIDFGTSNSAIIVGLENGTLVPVRDPASPSEISSIRTSVCVLRDDAVVVGHAAENAKRMHSGAYRSEFKRDFGERTPTSLSGRKMTPDEMTTEVLQFLREQAQQTVPGEPERVVITVPAAWEAGNRELMRKAAERAGYDAAIVELIPEPVAALAYAFGENHDPAAHPVVLVYDLGGGTFDCAVAMGTADGHEILGEPGGLDDIGGAAFDRLLLSLIRARFPASCSALLDGPAADRDTLRRRLMLKDSCETFKCQLSVTHYHEDLLSELMPPEVLELTRADFEALVRPPLEETVAECGRVLASLGLDWADVDRVIPVGGSSRIPLVGQILAEATGRVVLRVKEPEMAIVQGAALIAQIPASRPPSADSHRSTQEELLTGLPNLIDTGRPGDRSQSGNRPVRPPLAADQSGGLPEFDGLLLLARTPESAYAVWNVAVGEDWLGRDGGGLSVLRLLDVDTGVTVASHRNVEWRGDQELSLPSPGRRYVAEIVVESALDGEVVVVARSNEIVAPPNAPQSAREPVFASAADLQRALESGQPVHPTADVPPRVAAAASGSRQPTVWMLWPSAVGSEARLFGFGSEMRLSVGSGGGLRTEMLPLHFLMARAVRTPRLLADASDALARALWQGGTADDAHAAAAALVAAMAAVGTRNSIAIVVGPSMPTRTARRAARLFHAEGEADAGASDGGTTTATAVVTSPSQVAGVGSAATGFTTAVTGALGRSVGEGWVATTLGWASDLAWSVSAGFALLSLLVPSPIGPEPPVPGVVTPLTITNPDGSVTIVSQDGTTVTIGPPSSAADDVMPTENPDGSVTITGPDGTTITIGPVSETDDTTSTTNPDGSVTVTGPDGSSVTFGPPTTAGADREGEGEGEREGGGDGGG